jgi:hypothetical protein
MSTITKQPISTAPRDGIAILSDCGIVCYLNQKDWGSPVPDGKWALCYPGGNPLNDSDDGIETCEPKFWAPLPDWVV